MRHQFLVHDTADMVGVAVQDLDPGPASGRVQQTGAAVDLDVHEAVPLGHKVALRDVASGDEVIEYGIAIGRATKDVRSGEHVHVHNLKGQRWA